MVKFYIPSSGIWKDYDSLGPKNVAEKIELPPGELEF